MIVETTAAFTCYRKYIHYNMKTLLLLFALSLTSVTMAQQGLPHGTTFGEKTSSQPMATATKLAAYMGNRIRVNCTISGRIIKVTKAKGGWFDIDGGNGKIVAAHFNNYSISLPLGLKGHNVIITGVAQKQVTAENQEHFAGGSAKKQATTGQNITFEVAGLMVE